MAVRQTRCVPWGSERSPATSGRAGIEFARSGAAGHPARLVALMFEVYEGPSPYGQFFQSDVRLMGVGFHFSL